MVIYNVTESLHNIELSEGNTTSLFPKSGFSIEANNYMYTHILCINIHFELANLNGKADINGKYTQLFLLA
jgi:hypothetical protein